MEVIERFDINLDLRDRKKLHDYVECTTYERPASGKWDLSVLRGKGTLDCVHEDDENGQFRVSLLDKAFSDKRFLEKPSKKKDEAVFDPEASFFCDDVSLPKRVIPFYKPGDVIRGSVDLTLKDELKAEKVVVSFLGWAFVKVLTSNGKTSYYVYSTTIYVKEKIAVWINKEKDTSDISEKFKLLGPDGLGGIPRGTELRAGNHKFHFEFTMPLGTPQSTPPLLLHCGNRCHIVYRLKASIDKGNRHSRGNIVTHRGLWLRKDVDIASIPANLEPVQFEQSFGTRHLVFWKSGNISVKVMLPRTAFVAGKRISFSMEINNESKGVIDNVSARIRLYGKAKAKYVSAGINIKSAKADGGPVAQGMVPVQELSIPWDFSESSADGSLLPLGDLTDCHSVDIAYEIRIKLTRKGLHRNMEFAVPITIGNKSSIAI